MANLYFYIAVYYILCCIGYLLLTGAVKLEARLLTCESIEFVNISDKLLKHMSSRCDKVVDIVVNFCYIMI